MNERDQQLVLIVEDSKTMATALADTLAAAHFKVEIAPSSEVGLAYIQHTKPDLIILDLMLGKISGVDLLKEVRRDPLWGAKVPVIVLTNLPYLDNMGEVKKLSNKYVSKHDFEMSALVSMVNSVLPHSNKPA